MGVSARTIYAYEHGDKRPGGERIPILAKVLGVDEKLLRQMYQQQKDEKGEASWKKEAGSGTDAGQPEDKHVSRSQCRRCGYRWSCGGQVACQYILFTGHQRPAPVDGICPVRVMSEEAFRLPDPDQQEVGKNGRREV